MKCVISILAIIGLSIISVSALAAAAVTVALPNFIVPVEGAPLQSVTLSPVSTKKSLYGFEDQKFCIVNGMQTCKGVATVENSGHGGLFFGRTGDTAVQIIDLGLDGTDIDFAKIHAANVQVSSGDYGGRIFLTAYKASINRSIFKKLVIVRGVNFDSVLNDEVRTCSYRGENELISPQVGHVYLLREYSYYYSKPDGPIVDNYGDTFVAIKILAVHNRAIKIQFRLVAALWPSVKASPASTRQPFSVSVKEYAKFIKLGSFSRAIRRLISEPDLMSDRLILSYTHEGIFHNGGFDCELVVDGRRPTFQDFMNGSEGVKYVDRRAEF